MIVYEGLLSSLNLIPDNLINIDETMAEPKDGPTANLCMGQSDTPETVLTSRLMSQIVAHSSLVYLQLAKP